MDVKYFYLNNRIDLEEYIMIHTSIIPEKFMTSYNLKGKVHNGYILARVTNGMYGLPQAVSMAHDALFQHLVLYLYHPTKSTPRLWTHESRSINFTLVVKKFGMEYDG